VGSNGALGTLRAVGSFLFVFGSWTVLLLLCSNSAIVLSALVLVSVSGASGDPVMGFWRACRISFVALVIMSVDDAVGTGTVVGNQVSVLAMHSRCVSVIQVR